MKRKIKIVHIITSLGIGGAERLLLDLVTEIDRRKFDVTVITVVDGGHLAESFRQAGVRLLVNHKRGKIGLGVLWRIYKQLRELKPHIVHTHLFGGDTWGRIAAKMAGVPAIVSTAHNSDVDEGVFKKLVKFLLSNWTRRIIAVSSSVRDYSVQIEKIASEKIDIIYNGVRLENFIDEEPRVLTSKRPVLAIIARLSEQKGHYVLFEAMRMMKCCTAWLRVIGEGPLEDELRDLARRLGLSDRIEFVTGQLDVAPFLRSSDIIVAPSLWEGLGLSLIEASLAARPIVAANVGGIPEVVVNGRTGLLVPPGNAARLAEALDWLILHPKEARALGWRAKNYAERFDLNRMVSDYQGLYFRLAGV